MKITVTINRNWDSRLEQVSRHLPVTAHAAVVDWQFAPWPIDGGIPEAMARVFGRILTDAGQLAFRWDDEPLPGSENDTRRILPRYRSVLHRLADKLRTTASMEIFIIEKIRTGIRLYDYCYDRRYRKILQSKGGVTGCEGANTQGALAPRGPVRRVFDRLTQMRPVDVIVTRSAAVAANLFEYHWEMQGQKVLILDPSAELDETALAELSVRLDWRDFRFAPSVRALIAPTTDGCGALIAAASEEMLASLVSAVEARLESEVNAAALCD